MDSVSQLVLGAAVSVAAMGRKAPLWQAALVGAVCGTLPDLDVFVDHGDAIRNMTLHRTESHALLWLTLFSPLLAWLIAGIVRQKQQWMHWWVAVWLALITHPLLDLMTVYGTQLGLPLTDFPYAIGSIYIIDPLYTLPLLICLLVAICLRDKRGLWWNSLGLTLSTLYLGWSILAQNYATEQVKAEIARQHLPAQQLLVTPTAFNTLVWRVLVMTPQGYAESYYSLLSQQRPLRFSYHSRGEELYQRYQGDWNVERVAWFSHGFFAMREQQGQLMIADLRMGEEPDYTFTFNLGRQGTGKQADFRPTRQPLQRPSVSAAFRELWERL